jgi:hypothetical protein
MVILSNLTSDTFDDKIKLSLARGKKDYFNSEVL